MNLGMIFLKVKTKIRLFLIRKKFEKQLNDFGIKWTHKFSVYDYLKESDAEVIGKVQFPDGTIQKKFKNED